MDVAIMKSLLLEERERIERELHRLEGELKQAVDEIAGEDPADVADNATETLEREIDESLEENAEAVLADIDAALRRIDDGSYGRCTRCGKEIPEQRLRAIPYATRCIDCQRLEERA